jgi:hypothetical protein
MLFVLFALVAVYGRASQVDATFDAGLRAAARSATDARSAGQARTVAEASLRDALATSSAQCLDTQQVTIDAATFSAGHLLAVTASCSYPVGDLGLPGAPGTLHLASSFTSPLDPNRGLDDGGPA